MEYCEYGTWFVKINKAKNVLKETEMASFFMTIKLQKQSVIAKNDKLW
jgi:hypothetical protein